MYVSPLLVSHDGYTFDGEFGGAITSSFDGGAVHALMLLNSKLFVGGYFSSPARSLAQWNGTAWSAVGGSLNNGASVQAMAAFDDGLVVAGRITKAGSLTVANIAYWTGVKWASLGAGLDDEVLCVLEHNGLLYAGGWFESSGGVVELNYIAAWDGVQWLSLDGGVGDISPRPYGGNYMEPVTVLATYQGDLVVSGSFAQAGSTPMTVLALWNGTAWVDYFGAEPDDVDAFHSMLELPDGRLLGVGDFITWEKNNDPSWIALWSDQEWHKFSPSVTNTPLFTLAHAFGVVYIAGYLDYQPAEYYSNLLPKGIWVWDPTAEPGDVALLVEVLGDYIKTMLAGCDAGWAGENCSLCDRGSFGDGFYCSPCPIGTYTDTIGSEICTPCPAHSTTLATGSVSKYCVCEPGFYGPQGGPCTGTLFPHGSSLCALSDATRC